MVNQHPRSNSPPPLPNPGHPVTRVVFQTCRKLLVHLRIQCSETKSINYILLSTIWNFLISPLVLKCIPLVTSSVITYTRLKRASFFAVFKLKTASLKTHEIRSFVFHTYSGSFFFFFWKY